MEKPNVTVNMTHPHDSWYSFWHVIMPITVIMPMTAAVVYASHHCYRMSLPTRCLASTTQGARRHHYNVSHLKLHGSIIVH